jgi:23S rRNA pseudouridine2605 synthase
MVALRLQKVLARAGVASRRAAEELIKAGRVRVDGHVVTELGTKVDSRSRQIEVDGRRIVRESPVYIALHKPRGVVSTMSDPEGRPSVRELLADVPARVFPVGRLDFNTSGLLIATNDGDFADGLLHPRKSVPKTYVVKLQGIMRDEDLDHWRRGVELEDGKTGPARVRLLRHEGDKTWLELTITEGKNQQIRRMGDATHFRVMRLARTSFAGITSDGLAPGRWRHLTADELTTLKKEHGVPKRVVQPPMAAPPPRTRAVLPPAKPRPPGRESVPLARRHAPVLAEKSGPPHRRRSEREPPPRGRDVLVEHDVVRQHVRKGKRPPRP